MRFSSSFSAILFSLASAPSAIPSRGDIFEAATDQGSLVEALQTQRRNVDRRPAVDCPFREQLPDHRTVLVAVAAVSTGHEQTVRAGHAVDNRMQIGSHVIQARVTAAEHRAAHHGEAMMSALAKGLHRGP